MHGRPCAVCDPVLEERVDRQYTRRTDCGNHTVFGHDDMKLVPLISFKRAASDTEPETNAWCETNVQTVCADSLWNRDFLYQAKTVDYRRDLQWDPHYCLFNGWLEPEVVALQHDFEGLKRKSEEVCQEEKYAFAKWNTTMTMSDMDEVFQPSMARGTPTPREAIFMGAWTCAMGSSGCDMAYCAYSFCKLPDGSLGKYDDCEGWDPVKGMPIHPAPTGKHGR
uniref:Uncharacterized protein n=1 Tax=Zooxanthella nutricula TaxID=1333877 RepID=A0A7S2VM86_9DINO